MKGKSSGILESQKLLEREGRRVEISRLLLVAIVQDAERTVEEIRHRLIRWLEKIHETTPFEKLGFFFDPGYGETIETTLHSLSNLNLVKETYHSEREFKATPIGLTYLSDKKESIEKSIGTSLEELLKSDNKK